MFAILLIIFSDLVHVEGQQRVLLAGHHDHGVGAGDGRAEQRDEAQQRRGVRARDPDHAHRLVDLDDGTWGRRFYEF